MRNLALPDVLRGTAVSKKAKQPPKQQEVASSYQPSQAELEADVSIHCDPNDLLRAAINYKPPKRK